MAERIEEQAIEIEADRLAEALYILKIVLEYGEVEEPDTEIDENQ